MSIKEDIAYLRGLEYWESSPHLVRVLDELERLAAERDEAVTDMPSELRAKALDIAIKGEQIRSMAQRTHNDDANGDLLMAWRRLRVATKFIERAAEKWKTV